ncbi:hypothetical protein BJ875DRAFT_473463 [Amylocarpus encephaloides]|uniref:Uncharacterized protein n=1 Tax=Amylocarpus encephaloides TaxID=45428 RepID=A0A9P7YA66_9HELO|nr:hypothetical protein BJ875DRAFT_473463 [Amylocarpus encephaloides]
MLPRTHEPGVGALKVWAFLALQTSTTSALSIADQKTIRVRSVLGIDWSPAPSPENGPPLSASALRDKSLLPAEIGGIVGAYLFSLCLVALFLVTCGRKARQRAQAPPRVVDVEMLVAQNKGGILSTTIAFDPSPITPALTSARNFSWPHPEKDEANPYVFPIVDRSPITPPGASPYVDHRVVQADTEMAARDLEDIYAHVMEQEDAKAKGISPKDLPSPVQSPRSMPSPAPQRGGLSEKTARRPSNITVDENKSTKSRASSIMSALSPRRSKPKPMQISSPLATPSSLKFGQDVHDSDREPLSPKYYKPPPPVPTDQEPYQHHSRQSSLAPASPTRSIAEQLAPYGPGGPGNGRHRQMPSQGSVQSLQEPASALTTHSMAPLYPPTQRTSPKPVPKPLHPIPTASNPPSTNASTRTLPFRAYESQSSLKSPTFRPQPTKTTVLERSGPQHGGPQTAGLKTPWSAGATPYSPFYQPFTPMIPVTPRLVTKQDRKMMKKMEKKEGIRQGPAQELIKSEEDLWDSGY